MRIAQLSTPFISVPPKTYGGTELVVYNLTEGLVKRGHKVTLFAPGDSRTSAMLFSPFQKALDNKAMRKLFSPLAAKLFWLHSLPTLYHSLAAFENAEKFDIIHNHLHYIGLLFTKFIKTPVVHTYHGDFASALASPIEKMILEKYKDANWVAISESQKRNCQIPLNFVSVIHHGIAINRFTYKEKPGDYLVWLGRVSPKKGIKEAISVAKTTKHQLIISGFINPRQKEFFAKEIRPYIDDKQIVFQSPVSHRGKIALFKGAKALLYPISWEEPFGLVMVEAMACGTPVIAYNRGSVPEIVVDGETGYIVNVKCQMSNVKGEIKESGIDGLCQAVERLYALPEAKYRAMRRASRVRVEKYFTVEKMVSRYEQLYIGTGVELPFAKP